MPRMLHAVQPYQHRLSCDLVSDWPEQRYQARIKPGVVFKDEAALSKPDDLFPGSLMGKEAAYLPLGQSVPKFLEASHVVVSWDLFGSCLYEDRRRQEASESECPKVSLGKIVPLATWNGNDDDGRLAHPDVIRQR